MSSLLDPLLLFVGVISQKPSSLKREREREREREFEHKKGGGARFLSSLVCVLREKRETAPSWSSSLFPKIVSVFRSLSGIPKKPALREKLTRRSFLFFLFFSLLNNARRLKRRHGKRSHPSGHRGCRRSSRPEDANRRSVQTKVRGVFESVRGVCGTHRRRRDWGETLHRAVFRLLVMCGPLRGWTDDETHELK